MSAFSDTLSQFIDDKKIKVYSMAKYCDTDRSTMYKFISGKRNPPSDEIIKKMAQFMHLSPMEWQKLKESWDVARIGADAYYKRKSDVYVLSGNDNYSLNGLIYNTSKKQVIELNNLSTKLDFGNDLTQEITIILKSNNTIINSLEFDNETPLSPVNDYLLKFDLSLSGKADYYLLPSQINDLSLVIEYIKNGTLQIKEFAINANKL